MRIKKKYDYYGSNYPLDLNRASTEGTIYARNSINAKNILKRQFKYFVIFKHKTNKVLYIKKGRVY